MKKLLYSLVPLALAATAANAQNTGALPPSPGADQPATTGAGQPDTDAAPGQGSPDATAPSRAAPDGTSPASSDAVPGPSDATAPGEAAQSSPSAVPQGGAVASADVTDAEVQSYAQATAKVQKIVADASLNDQQKQQQMAAAVTGAGLQPQRFNQISQALASDQALRARIQAAMGQSGSSSQS